LNAA
jgi:hypothetical protein